ncbi:PilZ domain-containing protein [Desulfogranum mediterraneum]|uniref:PilZ domain-containing protein n=1 Tax=Desulfogranum mediterraneum TaxID=160661 RepID=UPI00040D8949|nr:PilZ domain-containing protein [Desulfogranum mediterraneum]
MATVKAYVRANHTATISCPACGATKTIQLNQLKNRRRAIKIRCRCQAVFEVQFDYRHTFRKLVNLPGTYLILQGGQGGGVIHIQNISRGGIGFTVSGMHQLRAGLLVGIEFQLNDKKQTIIKKKAEVLSVQQNKIGCQFSEQGDIGKDLGFFLRS